MAAYQKAANEANEKRPFGDIGTAEYEARLRAVDDDATGEKFTPIEALILVDNAAKGSSYAPFLLFNLDPDQKLARWK